MTTVDSLATECLAPGRWMIEGIVVRKVARSWWVIEWADNPTSVSTLAEAKRRIVDAIENGTHW